MALNELHPVAYSKWLVVSYLFNLSSGYLHLRPLSQNPEILLNGTIIVADNAATKNIWETPWYTKSLYIMLVNGLEAI